MVIMPNSDIDIDATKEIAKNMRGENARSRSSPDTIVEKMTEDVLGDASRLIWKGPYMGFAGSVVAWFLEFHKVGMNTPCKELDIQC